MKIKKAITKDAKELTLLTIRSKSYWDYSQKQIADWENDLTITEEYITEKQVYKLMKEHQIIGYYSFFSIDDSDLKLENLFIEPSYIGKGIGKKLMSDFFSRIETIQFKRVILYSDPNSEKFYSKLGFEVIGKLETSIKNRYLPIMEMKKDHVKRYVNSHSNSREWRVLFMLLS